LNKVSPISFVQVRKSQITLRDMKTGVNTVEVSTP